MIRRPPISTRTDTLFPYTTLFRSTVVQPSLILPSNFATAKQSQLSQELRLASPTGGAFDYVVGGFYFKQLKSGSIDQKIRLRSEEHTSELQSLMRISYAVFCLKKKN